MSDEVPALVTCIECGNNWTSYDSGVCDRCIDNQGSRDRTAEGIRHQRCLNCGNAFQVGSRKRQMCFFCEMEQQASLFASGEQITSTNWSEFASCLGADDSIFYPKNESSSAVKRANDSFCGKCPVRVQCLEEALRIEEDESALAYIYGIRGGLSSRDRRKIISRRLGIGQLDAA